jgi:hypothetical protein
VTVAFYVDGNSLATGRIRHGEMKEKPPYLRMARLRGSLQQESISTLVVRRQQELGRG